MALEACRECGKEAFWPDPWVSCELTEGGGVLLTIGAAFHAAELFGQRFLRWGCQHTGGERRVLPPALQPPPHLLTTLSPVPAGGGRCVTPRPDRPRACVAESSSSASEPGGPLDWGAIVAREFGLPAVVNVPAAMRRIAAGDRLRVDGDRGRVSHLGSRRVA